MAQGTRPTSAMQVKRGGCDVSGCQGEGRKTFGTVSRRMEPMFGGDVGRIDSVIKPSADPIASFGPRGPV